MKQNKPIPLSYAKRRSTGAWTLDWMVLSALTFLALVGLLVVNRLFRFWW